MTTGSTVREQAFPTGSRTLEIFEGTERLNRWIYDRFAADIGRRVVEVGSGLGNITQFLLDRDLVVATDVEADYVARLEQRFAGRPNVRCQRLDLDRPDPGFEPGLAALGIDTVLAVNVLEHIRDDVAALRAMRAWVGRGGRVCLYVPALQALYGTLDEALGHYRRYERAELLTKLAAAGFEVRWCRWMNAFGILGWALSGKVLKRRVLPTDLVAVYDRLVPLFRLEDRLRLPFAMNLTVVAEGV